MAIRENDPILSPLSQGGMPGPASARHTVRVGDVERDGAAHELGEHYVAGRLTLEELHERLGLVLSARTHGQLIAAMADLPTYRRPGIPAMPASALSTMALSTMALSIAAPSTADRVPALGSGADDGEQADGTDISRFAAVGLLLLAMLIWLLTVLMFTRHGYYYPSHPSHYPGYPGHHYLPSPWQH